MCELCSLDENERKAAQKTHLFHADQMEALATAYRQMASGTLNPHSPEATKVGNVSRSLVRHLVAEWL